MLAREKRAKGREERERESGRRVGGRKEGPSCTSSTYLVNVNLKGYLGSWGNVGQPCIRHDDFHVC